MGNCFLAYLRGERTARDVIETMDRCQTESLTTGAPVYAVVE